MNLRTTAVELRASVGRIENCRVAAYLNETMEPTPLAAKRSGSLAAQEKRGSALGR